MATLGSAPGKPISVTLLQLAPLAVLVAWLAAACYALTYLVSH